MNKKSFTLMEILTVLSIFTIVGGVFCTIFYLNIKGLDTQIAHINLLQESNEIMARLSIDAKFAQDIVLVDAKQIVMNFPAGSPIPSITYIINADRSFQRIIGPGTQTLTQNADFANSAFIETAHSLIFQLTLSEDADNFWGQNVLVETSTEVCRRN